MSLATALVKLYARVPLGMRLGLAAIEAACARWEHPERAYRTVHIAGTNGKGSVAAMVESIARAEGLRTGLYTSPHLSRFAERIRIDGEPIDDATLATWLDAALDTDPELSFFEVATLAAFLAFRDARVDLAVLEVGIGGRLDATNVVPTPAAAAITRIAMDHMDRLGPTLVDIAREKAGIAKPGLDLVLGPLSPELHRVIDEVAHSRGATTTRASDVRPVAPSLQAIGLAGEHQRENARIAAVLGERIGASSSAIDRGLAAVRWPARLERIGSFLLDAAHNPDGAAALARHVATLGVPAESTMLVFGTLADKDWASMLRTLAPIADQRVYVSPQGSARSGADPAAMDRIAPGVVAASAEEAFALARAFATAKGLVIVCGSLVLVGAIRAELCNLPRDPPVAL